VWCRKQDGGHGSWNPHKECVTTHLQNHTAPKTDGAQAVGY